MNVRCGTLGEYAYVMKNTVSVAKALSPSNFEVLSSNPDVFNSIRARALSFLIDQLSSAIFSPAFIVNPRRRPSSSALQ